MATTLAGLGVFELDVATRWISCSEETRTHFGFAPGYSMTLDAVLGRLEADHCQALVRAIDAGLSGGRDFSIEFEVVHPNGVRRWLSMKGHWLQAGCARLLGVTRDVTDRKRTAELLERTIAERTAELEATVGELEAFSYSISHDLRAPLRWMQGYSSLLMKRCEGQLDGECRGYLVAIAEASLRMDRLIQDVLAFSRVPRSAVRLGPVGLDQLLREVVSVHPELQPPRAHLIFETPLPTVRAHRPALSQCLTNLLCNAVKFVRSGVQPRVRVRAEPAAERAGMIRLCVQDNGIGIPAECQERIFGIFQRLSSHYDGTGVGLAIVKKAAERMGGRVGVAPNSDGGSTFWLELQEARPLIHTDPIPPI